MDVIWAHLIEDLFCPEASCTHVINGKCSEDLTIGRSQTAQAPTNILSTGHAFQNEDSGYPYQAAVGDKVDLYVENYSSQLN